jgi:hypothetical protein
MKAVNDSSMSPEQGVLAMETLRKNIARSLNSQAKAFGYNNNSNRWEDRPAWMG